MPHLLPNGVRGSHCDRPAFRVLLAREVFLMKIKVKLHFTFSESNWTPPIHFTCNAYTPTGQYLWTYGTSFENVEQCRTKKQELLEWYKSHYEIIEVTETNYVKVQQEEREKQAQREIRRKEREAKGKLTAFA
jgi:hypothetical protein